MGKHLDKRWKYMLTAGALDILFCTLACGPYRPVDDLATSQLMTRFYKEMDRTDKREGLRTAQLDTKKNYPHTHYRASFQLTGNAK